MADRKQTPAERAARFELKLEDVKILPGPVTKPTASGPVTKPTGSK